MQFMCVVLEGWTSKVICTEKLLLEDGFLICFKFDSAPIMHHKKTVLEFYSLEIWKSQSFTSWSKKTNRRKHRWIYCFNGLWRARLATVYVQTRYTIWFSIWLMIITRFHENSNGDGHWNHEVLLVELSRSPSSSFRS